MFRTRAVAVLLAVAGILGATPLAANASLVRISGTIMRLSDQSKFQFPTTTNGASAQSLQWTQDGPLTPGSVAGTADYHGETYSAAWANVTPTPLPADQPAFYTKACDFIAADPTNPASLQESHTTKVGKRVARICTFSTATGTLQVLLVFNGPLLIKLAEQQDAPDVSLAPVFTTYVKTLTLGKLPKTK